MDRKLKWRIFWMGVLMVMAVGSLVPSLVDSKQLPRWFPFESKVQLGLDLQGGLQIVYSIDLDKAVDDKASDIKRDLDGSFLEDKIEAEVRTPLTPVGAVTIAAKDQATLDTIRKKYLKDYDGVVDKRDCPAMETGAVMCYRVSSDYADKIKESALQQAIETVRKRVAQNGIAEPSIVQKGDDIIVELPGLDDERIGEVKDIIRRTAKLEFKMVDDGSEYMKELAEAVVRDRKEMGDALKVDFDQDGWAHRESNKTFSDTYLWAEDEKRSMTVADAKERGCYEADMKEFQGNVECTIFGREIIETYLADLFARKPELKPDDNHQLGFELETIRGEGGKKTQRWRTYYLHRTVELGGSSVSRANTMFNQTTGMPEVLVTFNRYGGRRFGQMTSKNIGKKMAIILDDEVRSAPVIQAAITGGSSNITMGGGGNAQEVQKEADKLVAVLRTGSLPAPLQEESESMLGPTLGRDAVDKAKFSFILGSILVVLLMVYIYRMSGIISILALVMNLLLMMAVLSAFGAELTLPGIAALVLTVGMAVDANIIIYERIREELRAGKSVRGAVDAGFDRGFAAILDGQLTTAAAGYVLFNYGSGPIQGFATMLLIGIVCTLFTAYWCTRRFFEMYVSRGRTVISI